MASPPCSSSVSSAPRNRSRSAPTGEPSKGDLATSRSPVRPHGTEPTLSFGRMSALRCRINSASFEWVSNLEENRGRMPRLTPAPV